MTALPRLGVVVRRWAQRSASVRTPKVEVPAAPAVVPTRGHGPFHRVRATAIRVARQGADHLRERRPGSVPLVPLALPPGERLRRARVINAQHLRGSSQSGAVRLLGQVAVLPLRPLHLPVRRAQSSSTYPEFNPAMVGDRRGAKARTRAGRRTLRKTVLRALRRALLARPRPAPPGHHGTCPGP